MRQMTVLGVATSTINDEGNGFHACIIEIKNAKQEPLRIKIVFRDDLSSKLLDKIKVGGLVLVNGIFDFNVSGNNLSFVIIVNDITLFNADKDGQPTLVNTVYN